MIIDHLITWGQRVGTIVAICREIYLGTWQKYFRGRLY